MLRSESYKKGIVVSTGLNIVVKAMLFLNTIIIAFFFGTSITTDLYFYIFSTITLTAGLLNGMDLAVIVPEGMHIKEDEGMDEAMMFYNFFGLFYLIAGVVLFILLFFFAVPIYSSISTFKSGVLSEHKTILLLSSLLPLLLMLSNYLTAVLTTLKYFTAPLLASGIAQLSGLITLVIFHNKIGISAALIGILCGYFLNILLLLWFMRFTLQWKFKYHFFSLSKRIRRNLLTVQLGNLSAFVYNYGIILILSSLAAGIYSSYTYSMQIVNMPNNLILSQAAAVAGIKFNELAAKSLFHKMNKIFMDSMAIIMFMIVPICFLTFVYADSIVSFLFYRGNFSKESAQTVVLFIKYLVFLLPCMAINTFLSRLLVSVKKVKESFYFQVGFNLVTLLAIFISTRYFYLHGFMWSIIIVYYLYFTIVCSLLMKWLMNYIDYIGFLKLLLKIIVLNLPLLIISIALYKDFLYIIPFLYIGLLFIMQRIFKIVPNLSFDVLKFRIKA